VRSELSAREAEWKERERVLVLQTEDLRRRLDLERDDAWTLGESFQFGTIFDYSHAPESANGNEELS
jgi:hypothetical protein